MNNEIRQALKLIKEILANDPITRSDDKELILAVWEVQGLILTPEQKNRFKNAFSAETIRRTRAKLNEQGEFLPPTQVLRRRKRLNAKMREEMRHPLTEQTVEYEPVPGRPNTLRPIIKTPVREQGIINYGTK